MVNEISKIQISHLACPKTLFWRPSKTRQFSSKSAYHVDRNLRFKQNSHPMPFNWKSLWNSKLHNRHKLFLWRIANDIFPCKAWLHACFKYDLSCWMCNSNIEDLNQIFIISSSIKLDSSRIGILDWMLSSISLSGIACSYSL